MSDEDKPKKTGFAANPEGINRGGRPKGSKNKLPSDKELEELASKNVGEAMSKLVQLMRSGKEDTQFKAAVKICDIHYKIAIDLKKAGKKTDDTTDTPKAGSEPVGNVVSLTMTS